MTAPVLGMTPGMPIENDRALIERLIDAFLRSNESASYGEDSQWTTIRRMQESIVDSIRSRDTAAISNILRRPHEGYLFYGFEDLGIWSVEAYNVVAQVAVVLVWSDNGPEITLEAKAGRRSD